MKNRNERNTPYYTYTDTTWYFDKKDKERTGYSSIYNDTKRREEEERERREERFFTRCY